MFWKTTTDGGILINYSNLFMVGANILTNNSYKIKKDKNDVLNLDLMLDPSADEN